ncbi:bifunctional 2-polyprenyl-6-hydroxyphenol methylase/3-demethylubiquinol 3-O-methyltransferase UbiG [Nocardia sp. XZ_19_385]|uniref:class I SAM-dependent methyltransferase n=1 Tax=Nocardia sp. XZ_19_385 TaxID=2769488 RepID=UPI00188F4B21|nr:class I SAM-dependent methyltransferase [Nocardia sp. XZ_19_385]
MATDEPLSAAELFDAIGVEYERAFRELPEQGAALGWLSEQLPGGARVIDVGSGTGVPSAQVLSGNGFRVEGIDVSSVMVEVARRQVPGAVFYQADVRDYEVEAGGVDAVCAFFPLLQMTRAEIDASLHRMAGWLRAGGYLVLATVPADIEQVDVMFMGRPARVSSYGEAGLLALLDDAGFEVLQSRQSTFTPDHPQAIPEPHLFVYCRRRA